ncbi:MAG: hypothetical protein L0L39_02315 [Atopostipes suicloacalis]|nr:hypothetical protein [Atopostipes suicloacalis]MDN6730997.1 hypothetical protein [Atopostipes suicloacalis]
MTIIELGALASGLLALITLTGKIVKLITSIQSLIQRIDQLQEDMTKNFGLWQESKKEVQRLDQRLSLIEYELAII